MSDDKAYGEDIQKLLKTVYDDCMQEDIAVRERQIRSWRRLKLLWEGYNRVWFSETAHDWRIWNETEDEDNDQSYYDKPINVFKAYLESIIAALSAVVPPAKCFPDDADNTLDLATAKAGDKIGQLVYRHNNATLKWLHGLFVSVTEGCVAFYNYTDYDKSYGTYKKDKTQEVAEENQSLVCSKCGFPLDSSSSNDLLNEEIDKFGPSDSDAEIQSLISQGKEICPKCLELMDPQLKTDKFITTRIVGSTQEPKGRICIESYGGLYIRIPNYCKTQKSLPYLIFSEEKDYSVVAEEFEHLHGNKNLLKQIKSGQNPGGYEYYAQWGRLSPQYQGEYPRNVVTVNKAWIRPAKFNILEDKADVQKLKKLFPDGVLVTFVNDEYACACNECLDDHWTLTENPLSDYLHFEPLGQSLVSIQDITNDLISLTLQTIEHGIGQTFADPAVVDFNAYSQTSALPGGIFPATAKSGKGMADSFHELKTATLSPEVMPFGNLIQSMGQTVSGALPSIFGGQQQGAGGDTASGYQMSKSGALQRLQNTWKLFTTTWKDMFGKIIPQYIDLVVEDERDVQLGVDGNFINVLIKKAELEGKIGKVELEAAENLPMSWSQKKDLMMTLLQATNPKIMEILNAPENSALIHDALGLVDFYVPNEEDVIKQYDEIKTLVNSTPLPSADPNNPNANQSSVPIDPDFDNHAVEFEICRKWIISEAGRECKLENPDGYENVLLHGKAHLDMVKQAQTAPQPPKPPNVSFAFKGEDLADPQVRAVFDKIEQLPPPMAPPAIDNTNSSGIVNKSPNTPNAKPDKTKQPAPIMNESDVHV
jgi:hypothetical protein